MIFIVRLACMLGMLSVSLVSPMAPMSSALAQNTMSLPQLTARVKKGGTVVVTISPIWSNATAVTVQRKMGKGKFKTIAKRKVAGSVVRVVDKVASKKGLRYRAQFTLRSQELSSWSVESPAGERTSSNVVLNDSSNCPPGFTDTLALMVNQLRVDNGLGGLSLNEPLTKSAQIHSNKMAERNLLTHDGWIPELRAAGFLNDLIGQNVAVGFPNPESVLAAWFASPGHRSNLLQGAFVLSGYGCTVDPEGTIWWTHNFGG